MLIMAACADADANAGSIERDSAGIRIAENDHTRPAWTDERAWRLSREPVVSIGGMSGDSAQLLYRVIHARRLSDGTIAVVNSGSRQVRIERVWTVFDARGRFLGDVTMPAGFTPFEIGADYVLGRWMDDLDVEYVHVYALDKP